MTFFYCWHRPGRRIQAQRYACRHCGVAIEECPGVSWRNSCVGGSTCPCEGSGWVAIVRSKRQALAQTLMASKPVWKLTVATGCRIVDGVRGTQSAARIAGSVPNVLIQYGKIPSTHIWR